MSGGPSLDQPQEGRAVCGSRCAGTSIRAFGLSGDFATVPRSLKEADQLRGEQMYDVVGSVGVGMVKLPH